MARKALIIKCQNRKQALSKSLSANKKPHHATRVYNRCRLCSRNKGYMRQFEMCRICFRELASRGQIMGITKSSW